MKAYAFSFWKNLNVAILFFRGFLTEFVFRFRSSSCVLRRCFGTKRSKNVDNNHDGRFPISGLAGASRKSWKIRWKKIGWANFRFNGPIFARIKRRCSSCWDKNGYDFFLKYYFSANLHSLAFLRKVFGILSIQLLFTTIVGAIFLFTPGLKGLVQQWSWMLLLGLILSFVLIFAMMIKRHEYPTNYILLAAWVWNEIFMKFELYIKKSFVSFCVKFLN